MEALASLIIAGVILGLTYALASEGLWGAALMFFNVLFAGLIAFNFYEPLARLLAENVTFLSGFADTLCLFALFIVSLVLLRLTTETLGPSMVRFPTPLYHLGRWFFAFLCAVVTVAICVLGFDTAPVHKKVFGSVDYKTMVPFGLGIERHWLGFFQYTTGQVFVTHVPTLQDPFGQYKHANVFDPRAEWLLNHQEARPYGEGPVLEEGGAGAPAPAGGAPAGGAPPGAPGAPAPPPGAGAGNSNPADPKVVGPAVGGGVVLPQ
jgi:hypothetical protein